MSRTYRKRTGVECCHKPDRVKKKMGYIGVVMDGEQITGGVSDTFAGDEKVKNGWKDVYEPALKKECKRSSAKYSRRKGKEIVNNERTAIYE